MKHNKSVLVGSIKSHMLRMAFPAFGGMLAITIFNCFGKKSPSSLGGR